MNRARRTLLGRCGPHPAFLDDRPRPRGSVPLEPREAGRGHAGRRRSARRVDRPRPPERRRAGLARAPSSAAGCATPARGRGGPDRAGRRCPRRAAIARAGPSPRSPRTSASQRGRALSVARSGSAGQGPRPGDREHVGRVAVVRERDQPVLASRGRHEGSVVGGRRERDRPGSEDHERRPAGAPRRTPAGALRRPARRVGQRRPSRPSRRPPGTRRRCRSAMAARAAATQRSSSPARGARLRVQDEHGDVGHSTESSDREARHWPGWFGRTSGSGRTSAIRPRRSPRGSARSRRCPGARLRGVSRLYATKPVGVVDQPEFRNAAVALDVPLGPDPATGALALLVALKRLERGVRAARARALGAARA